MATIANLQRMTAKTLSEKLLLAQQGGDSSSIAVVDVRDDDYIGGHIKGCINIPSRSLDAMMPTLVRRLKDKQAVVFHCALSQQRGPSAALKYMRERDDILKQLDKQQKQQQQAQEEAGTGEEGVQQTVYVLDRGFTGWQEVYGEDERLTEGYRKDLWQEDY